MSVNMDVSLDPRSGQGGDVALLIDWENIKFSLQEKGLRPNLSVMLAEARGFGRVVLARAYADFQLPEHGQDARTLYGVGIEPIYVPTRIYGQEGGFGARRKNSVDVRIAADAVEFCHRYPNIQTFLLGSGDGDFLHIVNALRPYGKRVVIVAVSWSASAILLESSDQVLLYDKDIDPRHETDDTGLFGLQLAQPDPVRFDQILQTIRDVTAETRSEGRTLLMTQLKVELVRRIPWFKELDYGYSKFKPLVVAAERQGLVKVVTIGLLDWVFLPDEEAPEELRGISDSDGRDGESAPYQGFNAENVAEELLDEVVRFLGDVEASSPYMTIGHVLNVAEFRALLGWPRERMHGFLNHLLADGLLVKNERDVLDPATGAIRRLRTLELNAQHPTVQRVLGASQ